MKAPHTIKYNDKYYHPGDELPKELEELIKPVQEKHEEFKDSIKEKSNTFIVPTVEKK